MSDASTDQNFPKTGPYKSVREYVAALEARGRLVRIPEMDQDQYESTGFAYRLIDHYGYDYAPAFLIERIKQDGEWIEGPILCNLYGSWQDEALVFGLEDITDDMQQMYHRVLAEIGTRLDSGGQWKKIDPITIDRNKAPCKEVVLTGDEIDLKKFAFIKNNPADADRYINMSAVILEDEELGRNVGTYRSQLKSKNKLGLNTEPGQHGWQILNAKKLRGEKIAHVAIAFAPDPITFSASSTKLAVNVGDDEYPIIGGLMGQPLEIVKCETNDIMVPAHSEMIIEGEIPLDQGEDEGPYGEMYGYLGPKKPGNFFVNVTCVTHREKPWILNSFTGITNDMPKSPQIASQFYRYKKSIPNLTGFYSPRNASGMAVISIDKKFPGEGISAGLEFAANQGLTKVVIVVDKDINILDPTSILHAMAARWQPTASILIPQARQRLPDPSLPTKGLTSKMIIDTTQQFPEEGGPESWAPVSRALLQEQSPQTFDMVDKKWSEYLQNWPGKG
ncbi:MAG: UbiD family decarboxylase [Alphaproteobacteria bacterium]|nr:MAG: UbiD family decarboxylase [Alphaproteobacteria bacterium]